ncbi:MAG: hypothetical protein ACC614_02140 [Methanobacterium formicicum]|jgi:hypothetical protein|uniref:hypothetical protein n=1 Tax=Methanobacterium formicicum TaxID=2162 RepID=UPI003530CB75
MIFDSFGILPELKMELKKQGLDENTSSKCIVVVRKIINHRKPLPSQDVGILREDLWRIIRDFNEDHDREKLWCDLNKLFGQEHQTTLEVG